MIVINDGKMFCVYCRTNRRVKWQYSTYGGRYETKEKAISAIKDQYGEQRVEYLIEVGGETVDQGFIN